MDNKVDIDSVQQFFSKKSCQCIIICCETGIFWEHQAGHDLCAHPSAEGYILPLHPEWEFYEPCGDWLPCEDFEIDEECLDEMRNKIGSKMDESLSKLDGIGRYACFKYFDSLNYLVRKIRFDYERKNELMEAWIPVNVWLFNEESPKKGYLCYQNCD